MISQSAWKDYSASNGQHTNYAYETFNPHDASDDPKRAARAQAAHAQAATTYAHAMHGPPPSSAPRQPPPSSQQQQQHHHQQQQQQRSHPPQSADPRTYSLPRASNGGGGGSSSGYSSAPMGYGSYDRRAPYGGGGYSSRPGMDYIPPDHYFMPSQRKYSGENIRVYVDYNK